MLIFCKTLNALPGSIPPKQGEGRVDSVPFDSTTTDDTAHEYTINQPYIEGGK